MKYSCAVWAAPSESYVVSDVVFVYVFGLVGSSGAVVGAAADEGRLRVRDALVVAAGGFSAVVSWMSASPPVLNPPVARGG